MKKEKTAVEWLSEVIKEKDPILYSVLYEQGFFNEALEMGKQQIKKAFTDALVLNFYDRCLDPEYYYQKTYK